MSANLDLHDIQGNIVFGYGRFGYPKARYVFFRINEGQAGRTFLQHLIPFVTTSAPLDKQQKVLPKPSCTTNLGFNFAGLAQLGVPDASLRTFPEEFRMGMAARAEILGDDETSAPEYWDSIWRDQPQAAHLWVSLNAIDEPTLEQGYQRLIKALEAVNQSHQSPKNSTEAKAVELLLGHRGPSGDQDLPYQEGSAIYQTLTLEDGSNISVPTAKEHFGYTDGISDPYFQGMSQDSNEVIGAGAPASGDPATAAGWKALDAGEFVLGHRDETDEYPVAPMPRLLSKNGSFMVYRKLHQNVSSFDRYMAEMGKDFPEGEEALKAKFVGRWPNGAPLANFPDKASADAFGRAWDRTTFTLFMDPNASEEAKAAARLSYEQLKLQRVGFNYRQDLDGARVPTGSHTRRVNPRGALEFGNDGAFATPGALVDRRRLLRRGLPYGNSSDRRSDNGEHGIIFMTINSSIKRQFEFVQQQWVNYGNDFKLSNDKDPLLGNHPKVEDSAAAGAAGGCPFSGGRTVIEGDSSTGKLPFICANIPRFVETRGGDYYFIPSLTALRMIAQGIVDPT